MAVESEIGRIEHSFFAPIVSSNWQLDQNLASCMRPLPTKLGAEQPFFYHTSISLSVYDFSASTPGTSTCSNGRDPGERAVLRRNRVLHGRPWKAGARAGGGSRLPRRWPRRRMLCCDFVANNLPYAQVSILVADIGEACSTSREVTCSIDGRRGEGTCSACHGCSSRGVGRANSCSATGGTMRLLLRLVHICGQ